MPKHETRNIFYRKTLGGNTAQLFRLVALNYWQTQKGLKLVS